MARLAPLCDDTDRLRAAIQLARGNITHAARTLGVTKPYCFELVRQAGLNEWARKLREDHGQPNTGHPRAA